MTTKEWMAQWQQKIKNMLGQVGADEAPCPLCQGTKHYALPFIRADLDIPEGLPVPNREGVFFVPLVCQRCMHVRFFLATGLPIAAEKAQQENEKGETDGTDS